MVARAGVEPYHDVVMSHVSPPGLIPRTVAAAGIEPAKSQL